MPIHMGFMVDKGTLGQNFLNIVWIFPVIIILQLLHTNLSVADYTIL